ncbi:hypothetical protein V6N13_109726 [Hibiscus sabdariffa]
MGASSTSPGFYGRKSLVFSFLWEPSSSLQLAKGAVNISWSSKGDTTSKEFFISSFLWERVLYLQPSTGEIFRLQLSMGANL